MQSPKHAPRDCLETLVSKNGVTLLPSSLPLEPVVDSLQAVVIFELLNISLGKAQDNELEAIG